MSSKAPQQFVKYTFYRVDPQWRRLPEAEREAGKSQFANVLEELAPERGRLRGVPEPRSSAAGARAERRELCERPRPLPRTLTRASSSAVFAARGYFGRGP